MRVVAVVGQAQAGKTTLAWDLVQRTAPRVLVLDPVRSKPLRRVRAYNSWRALRARLARETGPWRLALRSPLAGDYAAALGAARGLRYAALLADEALWLLGDRECAKALTHVARANAHFGAGLGVPLWLTAQRPMDLPADVRSQVDTWLSFRQAEPRDLAYLRERCTPDFADTVAALTGHQWAVWPELTRDVRLARVP